MENARAQVMAFLEKWKPFADLAPGNPARRGVVRLLESDDPDQRRQVLLRVSPAARLHEVYDGLGIRRLHPQDKSGPFAELLALPVTEMARALAAGEQREFLGLLQACFEFGRHAPEPRIPAGREFLLVFWSLPLGGPPTKYSIYPNGLLYSLPGATHDEMAQRFTKAGLGSGRPLGGGAIKREVELGFLYDTATAAFSANMKPEFVTESLRRLIRTTGGDDQMVKLTHQNKLSVN